jgi:sn-glycerol 3-phosphate transport system substrate-binding protein
VERRRSLRRRARIRLLAPMVALAVVAAACGGGSSDGADAAKSDSADLPTCPVHALDGVTQPVEIKLWHFLSGKTGDTLKALADTYNASQSKVKVDVENQGTSNDELFKKYQAGMASKDLPAIAVMDDTVTQQVIDSKTVIPATSCIQADNYDMSEFLQTGMDYYTVNGVLWPASINLSGALLYYNQGHFQQAGLDPKQTPKTLDEVRDDAQKIKDAHIAGVQAPVALKVNSPLIEMWLTGAGAPIVNNDNGRGTGTTDQAAFDDDTTRELYTWIKSMSDDGLLTVIPDTEGQIGQYLAMAQATASMTIETSTAAPTVEAFLKGSLDTSSVSGGDLGTIDPKALVIGAGAVPGIEAAGRLQMGGGAWYITDSGSSEQQAAAWDFMKFFNSLESQVTWNIDGGYLPYRTTATKDPRVVADWTNTLSGQWLAIAYDELLNGVDPNFPGPLMGPYDQFRAAIRTSIEAMIFKGSSPESVITQAADDTTKALQNYNAGGF